MKLKLENKVAIITGSGRGIGRSMAIAFANEGAKVSVVARTASEILETVKEIENSGGVAIPMKADVTDIKNVTNMVNLTLRKFGRIDILVNNAAVLTRRVPIAEVSMEEWNKTIDINLKGVFLCTKIVLPVMMKQKSGTIINVSSGVGKRVAPWWGIYGMSKSAIEYFTKVLAEEVKEYGITVNVVNPGRAATRQRAFAYPQEDPTTIPKPNEVVDVFVYLASESERKGITGQSIDRLKWKEIFHRSEP